MVRELLESFGVEVADDELDRFLAAEHAAWEPARLVGAHTHALLDSLRERGLSTGLVSNAFDPGWLLHEDLARMGLAERLDAAVFSSEVGKRKPHPAIFEAMLERLDVAPEDALFVGDRRLEDVQGAKALGMTTVQALWFRADDAELGIDPDFEAFTPMDVLNVVRRLTGEL
jgi:putative hydrolase of the HAD superfamily